MFESETYLSERTPEPEKFYGKYPGLVVENGPPDDADHRGELLVEVPGILEEAERDSQRPIRVIARPCFLPGFFFIPEEGAQVWVEFVAGDINSPVWTGVWYPTDASPPTADDDAPTLDQKIIRTRSGHVIQIDDSDGDEKIVIKHQSGTETTIEMKEDSTITMTCDSLTIVADVHITGDTEIDGDLKVGTRPNTTISGNEITGASP